MGWDKHYGFQLYQSDPSGNYGGWKATCIGNNSAVSLLLLLTLLFKHEMPMNFFVIQSVFNINNR